MADFSLPENLRDWPDDPYQLLGLPEDVDERSAKRAYVRLVRRFKPEHHPDEFQAIRGAYDTILQHIRWRSIRLADDFSDDWELSGEVDADRAGGRPVSPASEFEQNGQPSSPDAGHGPADPAGRVEFPKSILQQCDAAWQSAVAGREEEAYRELLRLSQDRPPSSDLYVRLYWLLTVCPEVDRLCTATEWLLIGLTACRGIGPLRELLRREVERDGTLALGAKYEALFDACSEPDTLLDIVFWRFSAAGRNRRIDAIAADVERLRGKFEAGDDSLWARLLLSAVDELAWADESDRAAMDSFDRYCEGLERLTHVHDEFSEGLDRLDLLRGVADGWRRLKLSVGVPQSWVELVPLWWTRDWTALRPRLLGWLSDVARQPLAALATLDQMVSVSPYAASQIGDMLASLRYSVFYHEEVDEEPERLTAPLSRLLSAYRGGHYMEVRAKLLELALLEAADPYDLAQLADGHRLCHLVDVESLSDVIEEDAQLRYVYLACRCHWG